MHPDILQSLAAERARDMHSRATAARRGRTARRGKTGRRGSPAAVLPRGGSLPIRETPAAGTGRHGWRLAAALRRLPRRIAAATGRRYAQPAAAPPDARPERYLLGPGGTPQTYQEFLFRTSGQLRHEPPAVSRSNGHSVR